jgi:hypothetical protein
VQTLRATRLAQLVTTMDPVLVAASFGIRRGATLYYLADSVDATRLPTCQHQAPPEIGSAEPMRLDCGAEFINPEVAAWLQARDIAQSRSRPCQKNDQAHGESKTNHVVRKHAFYWRDDTPDAPRESPTSDGAGGWSRRPPAGSPDSWRRVLPS